MTESVKKNKEIRTNRYFWIACIVLVLLQYGLCIHYGLKRQYLFCDEPNSGLDPKTSLVIDDLIHDITREYNMTTIINTHDMNSVMGIGEKIIYIYEGTKEWEGTKDDIFTSTNKRLNDFIFASDLLRKVKDVEIQNIEG